MERRLEAPVLRRRDGLRPVEPPDHRFIRLPTALAAILAVVLLAAACGGSQPDKLDVGAAGQAAPEATPGPEVAAPEASTGETPAVEATPSAPAAGAATGAAPSAKSGGATPKAPVAAPRSPAAASGPAKAASPVPHQASPRRPALPRPAPRLRPTTVTRNRRRRRLNAVCPAFVATEMTARLTPRVEAALGQSVAPLVQHVQGRLVTTREIGEATAFLASDRASFITGVALPVDNALTARLL